MSEPTPPVPAPPPVRSQTALPARITVVESVYYQCPGKPSVHLDNRFARMLGATEQVYTRWLGIGPDWVPLDVGWVENAHTLCLSNEEGKNLQRVPTPEEAADIMSRVVEIAVLPPTPEDPTRRTMFSPPRLKPEAVLAWLLRPGESMRVAPANPGGIVLRCRGGTAECVLTLFPV